MQPACKIVAQDSQKAGRDGTPLPGGRTRSCVEPKPKQIRGDEDGEHVVLVRRRDDLVSVFEDGDADPKAVDRAIDALLVLLKDWPEETGYDFAAHGLGQPQ